MKKVECFIYEITFQYGMVAELFEDKPDPNEKKARAGSATTHAMRSAPKAGSKSNKKTVGSQVQ